MRNLKLLEHHIVSDASELSGTTCISVNYDTGVIYCSTPSSIIGLDPKTQQVVSEVSIDGTHSGNGNGHVVGLQHLPDQMSVCAAISEGDVLLWNSCTGQVECVGSVESGLTAMSWSPDQELVVLTTGQQTLIMMTREFDPVVEVPIYSSEFGEAEFVTVGWGKKETQFHGSEGKQAAQKKPEDIKAAFEWDDRKPRISWRGDGQYFAVSSLNPETGARMMRVWSREFVLHSTSENVDGIEQCLAWKPSGGLIATSLRKPNKHEIAFFEKNGLRHGEFTLPFGVKDVLIRDILWNTESTVLAVWCEDMLPDVDNVNSSVPTKSYVQLWTVNNYHWYLKQSLEFPATEGDRVAAVAWDQEHAYRFHIVCHGGQYLQYTWSWCTDHSIGNSADDMATVAVIDGDKVLMTPFRKMAVPPPMSAYQLQMAAPVSQVMFGPPPHSNDVAVLLCNETVVFYYFEKNVDAKADGTTLKIGAAGGNGFKVQCDIPVHHGSYSFAGNMPDHLVAFPHKLSHLLWVSRDTLVFTTLDMMGSESFLCEACIDQDSGKLILEKSLAVGGFVFKMAHCTMTDTIAVQLKDSTVLKYSLGEKHLTPWLSVSGQVVRFPLSCTQMEVCTLGGQEVVLGLTERFRLYANDLEVANNCTSFAIHEEFLLLTTLSHTCRCICRKTSLNVLPTLTDGKAHPFDESIRRVERGSRIVHVVPDDTAMVLQMPRGNLEVIHPRALILSSVRRNLDRSCYKEAFMSMRKHRINMNLIYDHNPQKFLDSVETFIKQVDSPVHINLFLSDLQEEDVTVTMYTAAYYRTTQSGGATSKIDRVCLAVQKALAKIDSDKYLLSILTTHVKKSCPELSTALLRVKTLKDNDKSRAEEALKYLLFLVDVNELYDVALGTFDFDLVLMVAEKSQKDPKEYLPFLNDLRRLETNYQRYTIDRHLKRFASALEHISKCGAEKFPECLNLIKEHKLYGQALRLFTRTSQEYKDVCEAYGEYLMGRKQFEEAGLVYMRADLCEQALESFQAALNWRQSLCAASRLNYTPEAMSALSRSLADKLKDNRQHEEAACLYEQYANDVEEAIVCLIEGAAWDEALRMMYRHSRTDFIDTHFLSALEECHSSHMISLEGSRSDFERYVRRLAVVREQKEKARLELLEGGGAFNDADADLFSDTSSATGESLHSSRVSTTDSQRSTIYSKSSGRSSKNRRKMERKKWSLKEGSPYEDMALIEALSKIISQTYQLTGDIQQLLRAMVLFHMDEKALSLQSYFTEFLVVIDNGTPEIWDPDQEARLQAPVIGPDSTANSIALAMQQGQSPQSQPQLDPVLRMPPQIQKDTKWQLHMLGGRPDKSK